MSIDVRETIVAIASPPGSARRGIVRVSGEGVRSVVDAVFVADAAAEISAKRPSRVSGFLKCDDLPARLPVTLFFWPDERSYTGQPMAELHSIGSPPLLDVVVEQLLAVGARMANRGEFTMRSFLSGKIDLVQAEAVLGVIDASDHEDLKTALTQLGGGVTSDLAEIRGQLLALLGDLEAGLDFVEEDIEFVSNSQIVARLKAAISVVQQLQDAAADRLPSGHKRRVVLAGLPNAGKSTLFNALVESGSALVSTTAGTTRDYLIGDVALASGNAFLIDTAGWETADDGVMTEAQRLRRQQLLQSDLVIWCSAAELTPNEHQLDEIRWLEVRSDAVDAIRIRTQVDRLSNSDRRDEDYAAYEIDVSAETEVGLNQLRAVIDQRLSRSESSRSQLVMSTAVRCGDSLNRAAAALDSARHAAELRSGDEIIAFEIRQALQQIGVILGEVYTDDILDHIFSNFCIGK